MTYRKLRIAWSVTSGIVALLLCVLWVRSNSTYDAIGRHTKTQAYYSLCSQYGHITFVKGYNPNNIEVRFNYSIGQKALEPFVGSSSEPKLSGLLGLYWYNSHGARAFRELILTLPHWFVLLVAVAGGTAPWLPLRFSLRALLIATTLVAVVLGLVVWSVR